MLYRHGSVARRVNPGHRHLHVVAALGQRRRRHRHLVAQRPVLVRHHPPGKGLAVHLHRHRVVRLGISGHRAAQQHRHPGLAAVDGVITCHRLNADGVCRLSVQHYGFMRHRHGFIANLIMADQRHLHVVSAFFQHRGRHGNLIAQLTIVVDHRPMKRLPLNGQRHRIAEPGITADSTVNERWHTRFAGIDNIIISHGFNGHAVLRKQVDINMALRGHHRGISGLIGRGQHHADSRGVQHPGGQHRDAVGQRPVARIGDHTGIFFAIDT